MQVSTIIVDDEPLARQRVQRLLQNIPDIKIAAICNNGHEAVTAINQLQPDLVFLDIQMPGLDGFGVLNQINKLPLIIFVTAYDQYALQAFDYHAIDYLLKPYKDERFVEALTHAIKQIQLQSIGNFQQKVQSLRSTLSETGPGYAGINFEIKQQGRVIRVNSNDVIWISSAGNYVELHCLNKTYLYRSTISALEYELEQKGYLRIHRSTLLNKTNIERTQYLHSNNQYRFYLSNGDETDSARSYKDRVGEYLQSLNNDKT